MRKFFLEEKLKKLLSKLFKKDQVLVEAVMKKIGEIANCEDVSHYKNLRAPMQAFKRVHIKSSFVLIFKYNPADDSVLFYDLDHHDFIYR